MLDKIKENLTHNLARVESLVATYESHPDAQGQGRKAAEVLDILRAAVVLLHATLEDVLRSVAYWKLPLAAPEVLNTIPLVGHGSNPRKFLLGELSGFRGSTIDAVFTASVNAYLEQSNFNNTTEIASLLDSVGIASATVNGTFPTLQAMMERRHQIVHRRSFPKNVGQNTPCTPSTRSGVFEMEHLSRVPGDGGHYFKRELTRATMLCNSAVRRWSL
jgi:hypothetical protein